MEPCFIFTSDKLALKSEGENFFAEGYISTSDIDLVNDIVTEKCLLDMAEQMRTRSIKFDVEHEAFRGKNKLEVELNKTKVPVAKVDDFLVDKKGIKVRAMLNKHSPRYNEVKGSIEEGFLDAFSIAFVPVSEKVVNKDGKQVRLLDKINLLNVAFTGNPINTEAKMTNMFMKSLDYLKENNHLRDDQIKLQEVKKMSGEETKDLIEAKEEEKPVEESEEVAEEAPKAPEEETEVKAEVKAEVVENAEIKALQEQVEAQAKELAEVKALLKKPVHKSKIEQMDQSKEFVEEKSKNPLDLIG